MDNITNIYLDEITTTDVIKIFNRGYKQYQFKHKDCALIYTTDGYRLYVEDIDNRHNDVFNDNTFNKILDYYNNPNEFINTFKYIENILCRELFLSNWKGTADSSIREIDLYFQSKEYINKISKSV